MTHTLEPWVTNREHDAVYSTATGQLIADVRCNVWSNSELIAAAPGLLREAKKASRQLKAIAAVANKLPQRYAAEIYQALDVGWESIDEVIAKTGEKVI